MSRVTSIGSVGGSISLRSSAKITLGRTGRAGREGKAVTFFTDEDAPYLKTVANVILQSGFTVPDWIIKLPKPSKMKRRLMGKVQRPDTVNPARKVGRREAVKKRYDFPPLPFKSILTFLKRHDPGIETTKSKNFRNEGWVRRGGQFLRTGMVFMTYYCIRGFFLVGCIGML